MRGSGSLRVRMLNVATARRRAGHTVPQVAPGRHEGMLRPQAMTLTAPPARLVIAAVIGVLFVVACHPQTQLASLGYCGPSPADTLPLTPITRRASVDAPGFLFVTARTERGVASGFVALLDRARGGREGTRVSISAVPPGAHSLRVSLIGYHTREASITMPRDSSLYVDVPLSQVRDCADGEHERKTP